jgi:transcription elongation factor GreA
MPVITPSGVYRVKQQISKINNGHIKDYKEAIEASAERGVNEGNDEYFTLLHEIKKYEDQVSDLLKVLSDSDVLDVPSSNEKVQLGTLVTIRDDETGVTSDFVVVPEAEVTFHRNAVTPSSPMGSALMGLSVGDFAEFDTPARSRCLEVLKIEINHALF